MSTHVTTECPTSWPVCLLTMLLACISYVGEVSLRFSLFSLIIFLTSKARLPVKWMPPESLFFGEASTMSDV